MDTDPINVHEDVNKKYYNNNYRISQTSADVNWRANYFMTKTQKSSKTITIPHDESYIWTIITEIKNLVHAVLTKSYFQLKPFSTDKHMALPWTQ
jgi:hypothetical protein